MRTHIRKTLHVVNQTLKRAMDAAMAGVGLVILAPVMVVIAIAIKLDSPGKLIFSQERLGRDGKLFRVHKFRKFPEKAGARGPGVTVAGDVRMTRVGRFLESSKLDELPQLWNIVRGEMSFVGPRPESKQYADLFCDKYSEVLNYLPGIFGPTQVYFRNEAEMYPPDRSPDEYYRNVLFPRKAEMDIAYFSQSNIFKDIGWICRGLWVTLVGSVNWKRMIALRGPILVIDIIAVEAAWMGANLFRFLGLPDGRHWEIFSAGTWLLPVLVVTLMVFSGCYRYPVRYFSIGDALRMGVINAVAWILGALLLLGFVHRGGSVLVGPLGVLMAVPMMVLPRVWRREKWRKESRSSGTEKKVQILIYGAGRRSGPLVSLLHQGFPKAEILGFLDDNDRDMRGRVIYGRRVLGSERDLDTIVSMYTVDQIWTTFLPEKNKHRRLENWCNSHDVKLVILPSSDPFRYLLEGSAAEPETSDDNVHYPYAV